MKDLAEFAKIIVRPYIIMSSWTVILLMFLNELEVPPLLVGAGTAILGEYVIERAVKRLRKNESGKLD